jgi:hypothetical protein
LYFYPRRNPVAAAWNSAVVLSISYNNAGMLGAGVWEVVGLPIWRYRDPQSLSCATQTEQLKAV